MTASLESQHEQKAQPNPLSRPESPQSSSGRDLSSMTGFMPFIDVDFTAFAQQASLLSASKAFSSALGKKKSFGLSADHYLQHLTSLSANLSSKPDNVSFAFLHANHVVSMVMYSAWEMFFGTDAASNDQRVEIARQESSWRLMEKDILLPQGGPPSKSPILSSLTMLSEQLLMKSTKQELTLLHPYFSSLLPPVAEVKDEMRLKSEIEGLMEWMSRQCRMTDETSVPLVARNLLIYFCCSLKAGKRMKFVLGDAKFYEGNSFALALLLMLNVAHFSQDGTLLMRALSSVSDERVLLRLIAAFGSAANSKAFDFTLLEPCFEAFIQGLLENGNIVSLALCYSNRFQLSPSLLITFARVLHSYPTEYSMHGWGMYFQAAAPRVSALLVPILCLPIRECLCLLEQALVTGQIDFFGRDIVPAYDLAICHCLNILRKSASEMIITHYQQYPDKDGFIAEMLAGKNKFRDRWLEILENYGDFGWLRLCLAKIDQIREYDDLSNAPIEKKRKREDTSDCGRTIYADSYIREFQNEVVRCDFAESVKLLNSAKTSEQWIRQLDYLPPPLWLSALGKADNNQHAFTWLLNLSSDSLRSDHTARFPTEKLVIALEAVIGVHIEQLLRPDYSEHHVGAIRTLIFHISSYAKEPSIGLKRRQRLDKKMLPAIRRTDVVRHETKATHLFSSLLRLFFIKIRKGLLDVGFDRFNLALSTVHILGLIFVDLMEAIIECGPQGSLAIRHFLDVTLEDHVFDENLSYCVFRSMFLDMLVPFKIPLALRIMYLYTPRILSNITSPAKQKVSWMAVHVFCDYALLDCLLDAKQAPTDHVEFQESDFHRNIVHSFWKNCPVEHIVAVLDMVIKYTMGNPVQASLVMNFRKIIQTRFNTLPNYRARWFYQAWYGEILQNMDSPSGVEVLRYLIKNHKEYLRLDSDLGLRFFIDFLKKMCPPAIEATKRELETGLPAASFAKFQFILQW